MTKYVAFLRAINVGGHTVKMEYLRGLIETLGLKNVQTFIASGNVIFESNIKAVASLEQKIARHLEVSFGYEVHTFIRTLSEVTALESRCPFQAGTPKDDVYIAFLYEPPNAAAMSALGVLKNSGNDFAVAGREVFWLRRDKDDSIFLKSSLEKVIKMPTTIRNLTSIRKLVEKYA